MIKRDILSWWFRPAFLQPWGKKQDTLFAGPWMGEFGWELLNWQPFLRWLAPQYKKVVVSCKEGNQKLYQDFAHEFVFHKIQNVAECNYAKEIKTPEEYQRIIKEVDESFDHLLTVGWQPNHRKEFLKFGESQENSQIDILFHPRGRTFGAFRNWSSEKWNNLISQLEKKYRLGCIGLKSDTLEVKGNFVELRDQPLEKTLNIIASSKLVLGPSSGPMHLASLCGTPHLVWTDQEKYARGRTNRMKYEEWWNPFETTAIVLDEQGFQPEVDWVIEKIENFFEGEAA